MLQSVGRRFGAAINRRRARAGALWDGRFRTAVIDATRHLLDAIRYVEQTPVAAGAAVEATEHVWSSAAHHAGRRADALITEHPLYWQLGNTPFDREARHRALLEERLMPAMRLRFEEALQKSWAVGSPEFMRSLSALTDRPLGPRLRGRPKRGPVMISEKTVPK
jgi:putative transposase